MRELEVAVLARNRDQQFKELSDTDLRDMELGPADLGRAIGEVGHSGVTSKGWRRGCNPSWRTHWVGTMSEPRDQSPHPRTSLFSSSRAFRAFYRNLGGADAQKLAAA